MTLPKKVGFYFFRVLKLPIEMVRILKNVLIARPASAQLFSLQLDLL